MVFPELVSRIKQWMPSSELLSLNLKSDYATFSSTAEVDFYRKYPRIMNALGGLPAWSGESVSRETALGHSVILSCYQLLTGSVGFLPSVLKREVGNSKTDATDHPMYSAMRNAPNAEVSAQSFKETVTGDCMLEGDGFSKIIRRSGTGVAIGLQYLRPAQVNIEHEKQGQKRLVYEVLDQNGRTDGTYTVQTGKPQDIFHLRGVSTDGIRGLNILQTARNPIGTAIAMERNVGEFWKMGGRLPYHLESERSDGGFRNEDEFKNFRKDWEATYPAYHRAPILPNGIKLEVDGTSMRDAQSQETREWTVSDISRIWNISPNLVGDLSHGTFSNIEQLWLEFKTMTLSRWVKRWEQDFWRCVLTPEEQEARYFLKINVDALLRGDFTTRVEGYASAIQNGWLNKDEVRDLEDRNPLPGQGGQAYTQQLNMQTVPGTGAPTVSEQSILARIAKDKASAPTSA